MKYFTLYVSTNQSWHVHDVQTIAVDFVGRKHEWIILQSETSSVGGADGQFCMTSQECWVSKVMVSCCNSYHQGKVLLRRGLTDLCGMPALSFHYEQHWKVALSQYHLWKNTYHWVSLAVERRHHLQQPLDCIASHIKEFSCFLLDNGPKCFFFVVVVLLWPREHLSTAYKGCDTMTKRKRKAREGHRWSAYGAGTKLGEGGGDSAALCCRPIPCRQGYIRENTCTVGQPVFLGAATSGREILSSKGASAWQQAAKFANTPYEGGHSSQVKGCNADATPFKTHGELAMFSFWFIGQYFHSFKVCLHVSTADPTHCEETSHGIL